jgi:hypothetical protein
MDEGRRRRDDRVRGDLVPLHAACTAPSVELTGAAGPVRSSQSASRTALANFTAAADADCTSSCGTITIHIARHPLRPVHGFASPRGTWCG